MRTRKGTIRAGLYVLAAGWSGSPADWSDDLIIDYITAALPGLAEADCGKLLSWTLALGPNAFSLSDNVAKLAEWDQSLARMTLVHVLRWRSSERRSDVLQAMAFIFRAYGLTELAQQANGNIDIAPGGSQLWLGSSLDAVFHGPVKAAGEE